MQWPAWKGEGGTAKPLVLGVPSPQVLSGLPALAATPLTFDLLYIIHSLDLYRAPSMQLTLGTPPKDTSVTAPQGPLKYGKRLPFVSI